MFLKCYGCQIDERYTTFCSTGFDEVCRVSTCILQTFHSKFQPNWCRLCWNMNFFHLYILKNVIFLKVHFSKFPLCSIDFDELCRISTCILQKSHSQILAKLVQAVLRYEFFSCLLFSKNFKRDFLKSTFFKIRPLYARFSSSIETPCIPLEHVDMGSHNPILRKTQNSFFQHRWPFPGSHHN